MSETAVSVTYFDGTTDAVTFSVGDYVTVHDPLGDELGYVETVTPSHLNIQGPPLGGGDSRSVRWTISFDKVHQYVTKAEIVDAR